MTLPISWRPLRLAVFVLVCSSLIATAQVTAPAAAPVRDPYRAGMAAAARGRFADAARLLEQVPPTHPEYAQAMAVLGGRIYAESLGRARDGLPFVRKAYDVAPTNREVVLAYLRTHVLAGVLFDPKDIARERPRSVAPEYAFLVTKPALDGKSKTFPRAQLEADLDYLEHVLTKCFAYLELRPVDYRAALDAIRLSLDDETPLNTFELSLTKLITLFCDGHARIQRPLPLLVPGGCAPFVAGSDRGRVFLATPNGNAFLDPKHPYVIAMDGRPIADWMKVAGYVVVKESPQSHRRGVLSTLAWVNYLRAELGLPRPNTLTLQLESEDGRKRAERQVTLQPRPARPLDFPRGDSRRLGEFGYLRLAQMTPSPQMRSSLDDWMGKFRDTKGLILDVRGNMGGTKDILFTLFPYFMKPDAPMRIVEMTTYRLPMTLPRPNPGGLAGSATSGQTAGSSYWKTEEQRRQVTEFIQGFRPAWTPPAGKFSEWHALGLDARVNPRAYYYDKPVVVLQDSGTFSAGDIFVGAFEDHPNTTQIGSPTGGGNGLMENYQLPNTRIGLVLCWSAKLRPNGRPYDGVGIAPDVLLEATPEDLLGKSDSVLDAAVRHLEEKVRTVPIPAR